MSSSKEVITIRVDSDVKKAYAIACNNRRRSMSKQGELLIEAFIKLPHPHILPDKEEVLAEWDRLAVHDKTS